MTLDQLLAQASRQRLPRLEARMLLACATGRSPEWLVAHGPDEAQEDAVERFSLLAERRAAGEPMAYLAGIREFFSRPFRVTPAVLVPRPETELLVEVALALVRQVPAPRLLDLGTGSGVLAVTLALERPDAEVTATDVSSEALAVAGANAASLGAERVRLRLGDWWQAVDGVDNGFHLVVSNPPYIAAHDLHLAEGDLRFEPPGALQAGPRGDEALRQIIAGAPARLRPHGWLAVEHGHEQGGGCREMMDQHGLIDIATHRDLEHRERVTVGRTSASDNASDSDSANAPKTSA